MEKANSIFQITLVFAITIGLFFLSCKEEDKIASELKLDTHYLEIEEGETTIVNIESGNGNYTISLSPTGIVAAEISGNTIQISALTIGQTTLQVKDAAEKSVSVIIKVIPASAVGNITPRFVWSNDTIELEKPNDWGFTLFPERLAVTNIPVKKQYALSWSGGLSNGPKSLGILKIVEDGKLTQSIFLTSISVAEINSLYYQITFNQEDKKGQIIFSK